MGSSDYKWVRFETASFLVDGFQRRGPECRHYVLTHFHADHTVGLNKGFNDGTIYMSPETAALVQALIKVDPQYIQVLEYHVPFVVDGVTLTLLSANHCPGAAIVIMRDKLKTVVHTGDCRASPEFVKAVAEAAPVVDELYLDTTYCNPRYSFWPQEVALREVERLVLAEKERDPNTLFVVGSYSIGKEKVALVMGAALQSAVYVPCSRRWRILGLSGVRNSAPNAFTHTIQKRHEVDNSKDASIKRSEPTNQCANHAEARSSDASITRTGPAKQCADHAEARSNDASITFSEPTKQCADHAEARSNDASITRTGSANQCAYHAEAQSRDASITRTGPAKQCADHTEAPSQDASITHSEPDSNEDAEDGIDDDTGLAGLRIREEHESESIEYSPLPPDFPTVHMVRMMDLKHEKLHQLQKKHRASSICGFRPTGWTQGAKTIKPWVVGRARLYNVPYSEHSSFTELVDLVKTLKPKKIVPTVNASTREERDKLLKFFRPYMDRSADKGCIDYYLARWKSRKLNDNACAIQQNGMHNNTKGHATAASSRDMPILPSNPVHSSSMASALLPKVESDGLHREKLSNDDRIVAKGTISAAEMHCGVNNGDGGHAVSVPQRTIIDLDEDDDDDGYASWNDSGMPIARPARAPHMGTRPDMQRGVEGQKRGQLGDAPHVDGTVCGDSHRHAHTHSHSSSHSCGARALVRSHCRKHDIAMTVEEDNEARVEGCGERSIVGCDDRVTAPPLRGVALDKCDFECAQVLADKTRGGEWHTTITHSEYRTITAHAVRIHRLSAGAGDASDAVAGGRYSAQHAGFQEDAATRVGRALTCTGTQNERVLDDNIEPTFTKTSVILSPLMDGSRAGEQWARASDDANVAPDINKNDNPPPDAVAATIERQLLEGDSEHCGIQWGVRQHSGTRVLCHSCEIRDATPTPAVVSSASSLRSSECRGDIFPKNVITDPTFRRVQITHDSDNCSPAQNATRNQRFCHANLSSKRAERPSGLHDDANGNDILPRTDSTVPNTVDIVDSAAHTSYADTVPAGGMVATIVLDCQDNDNRSWTVFDENGACGNGRTMDKKNDTRENEGQKDSCVTRVGIAEKERHAAVHTPHISVMSTDRTVPLTSVILGASSADQQYSLGRTTRHGSPRITADAQRSKQGRHATLLKPRKRIRWRDAQGLQSHSPTQFLEDGKTDDQAGDVEMLGCTSEESASHPVERRSRLSYAVARHRVVDLDTMSDSDDTKGSVLVSGPSCQGDAMDTEGSTPTIAKGGQRRFIMLDSDDE